MADVGPFSFIDRFSRTGVSDPYHYYRHPLVGFLFRRRIQMGLDLLSERYGPLLEVGYGSGFLLPYFAQIADSVYGIDLDADPATVQARLAEVCPGMPVHLRRGTALEMPYADDFFDCVVAFSILEHISERARAIEELKRVTRPGGSILIGMPAVHKTMDLAFRAIGFHGIGDHHVTTPREMLAEASDHLALRTTRTLPFNVPIPLALYTVFLFEKPNVTTQVIATNTTHMAAV